MTVIGHRAGRDWVPFAVGVAAMLGVGGYKLTNAPLHWDEGATLDASTRSLSGIVRLASHLDALISPYYVFMHFWTAVFGESDLALRIPSLVALALGVGLVGELGRRLVSVATGVVAALLCTVLPVLSFHGLQARPYSFVFLFTVLATLALYRALEQPSWLRWTGYAACLLVTGVLQITALSLVAAHLVIVAARWYATRDRTLLRGTVPVAVAVVALLPLLYVGMNQRATQLNWVQKPTWDTWRTVPEDIVLHAPAAYLLFGLALAAAVVLGRRTFLELAACVVLPVLGLLTVSMLGSPVWVGRYVMFVLAPLSVLAAAPLTTVARVPVAVRATVALAVLTAVVIPFHQEIRVSRGAVDTRGMAEAVMAEAQPGDVVVFGDYTLRPTLFHYLEQLDAPAEDVPRDVLVVRPQEAVGQFAPEECPDAATCLAGVRRVWLATSSMADGPAPLDGPNPKMVALRARYDVARTWELGPGRLTLMVAKGTPVGAS